MMYVLDKTEIEKIIAQNLGGYPKNSSIHDSVYHNPETGEMFSHTFIDWNGYINTNYHHVATYTHTKATQNNLLRAIKNYYYQF